MSQARRSVLVVEDDASIRELLRLHLDLAGFTIDEAENGKKALDRARTTPFDLVLLDVMLPGLDGVSVCRAIRNAGPNVDTPILMLTARDGESDKVLGLESGADDYLTKPFGVRELMARIGALMRRHHRGSSEAVRGRAVHVHFKVRVPGDNGRIDEFTSQLYFSDQLTDRVHRAQPYAAHKGQRLLNSRDMIFREGGTRLVLPVVEEGGGYAATYRIAMRLSRQVVSLTIQ
jgi:DNA-binding response OmpR family regulator